MGIPDLVAILETMERLIPDEELEERDEQLWYKAPSEGEYIFSELVVNALNIIDELLITHGQLNLSAVNNLKQFGYNVYPLEKNSFGWLSGAIEKHGRSLAFG